MQRFLERDHDVRFDVRSALSRGFASAKSAEGRAAATASEKRFEEIAEAGSVEFKLNASVVSTPLIKSTAGLLTSPIWRRLESSRLIPIRAELIIFFALLRVAQDFVRFVDLLEFFFGGFFVLGDIRMI